MPQRRRPLELRARKGTIPDPANQRGAGRSTS